MKYIAVLVLILAAAMVDARPYEIPIPRKFLPHIHTFGAHLHLLGALVPLSVGSATITSAPQFESPHQLNAFCLSNLPAAGATCNKSCYHKAGLLPTKKLLFKLCGVSNVKIKSTTPPNVADMQSFCLTYIYHCFASPAALVKYQNCEANQALYNKNMYAYKAPSSFWGVDGKPPKFSAGQ